MEAEGLREVVMNLLQRAIAAPQEAEWIEPVWVETVFLDSTAVELDIHNPSIGCCCATEFEPYSTQ